MNMCESFIQTERVDNNHITTYYMVTRQGNRVEIHQHEYEEIREGNRRILKLINKLNTIHEK